MKKFIVIDGYRYTKCKKGHIGKPVFKDEEPVGFFIKLYGSDEETFCIGNIAIIDSYGTFGQNEEPSYDIMVPNFMSKGATCLCKHIRESNCYKRQEE